MKAYTWPLCGVTVCALLTWAKTDTDATLTARALFAVSHAACVAWPIGVSFLLVGAQIELKLLGHRAH